MRGFRFDHDGYAGDSGRSLQIPSFDKTKSADRLTPKREVLSPIPITPANKILRQLPAALLKRLTPHMKRTTFTGGEFIHRPDEDIEWVCFPETAVVSELQILEDGRTIEVAVTGCEGAVGLLSIFCPDRSTNWAQVSAPGTAVKVKRKALEKESRASEWTNSIFFSSIQDHIQQLSQKVACNAHHSVEERFSTWLLMVEERSGTSRLKLTQEHIARVLGVYRPSVTCIAQRMREAGLIDYVRGYIVIQDREGLKKRSCGCYRELESTAAFDVVGFCCEQANAM